MDCNVKRYIAEHIMLRGFPLNIFAVQYLRSNAEINDWGTRFRGIQRKWITWIH